jgi:AcrR family transcriptional regulator
MTWRVITYDEEVSRWEPDARGRLERAALELFAAQGFAETTVPQITEHAGLTTRTFFRHFADKREVLFASADELREELVDIVRDAPHDLAPRELLRHALERASGIFAPRFDDVRRWRAVVASDDALRERALRKQHLSIESMTAALRERGVEEETAGVTSTLAVLLMERAVGRWVAQPHDERPLLSYVHDALDGLDALR